MEQEQTFPRIDVKITQETTGPDDPWALCQCGHTFRAHDSGGCSAWIVSEIAHVGLVYTHAYNCSCKSFQWPVRIRRPS